MQELRLLDPNGYTVPDTVHTVSADAADKVRSHLLTEVAPAHAAMWADHGYDARDYRTKESPCMSVQAGNSHPLTVGTRVRHYGQQWPAARQGTATIREVQGPDRHGAYEYRVDTTVDFSRRPGHDNPETRSAWWSSETTIPTP